MYKLTVLFYLTMLTTLFVVSADTDRVFISTGYKNLQAEDKRMLALSNNNILNNIKGDESRPVKTEEKL